MIDSNTIYLGGSGRCHYLVGKARDFTWHHIRRNKTEVIIFIPMGGMLTVWGLEMDRLCGRLNDCPFLFVVYSSNA
jgi:hypothetical protein